MNLNLAFAPELPLAFSVALAALAIAFAAFGLLRRVRGSFIRALAAGLVALALFNPAILLEEREPLKSVVVLLTDRSGSQKLDGRAERSEEMRQAMLERLNATGVFEVREAGIEDQLQPGADVSTALFQGLRSALQDIPADQLAGAIVVTDGQAHDVPQSLESIGIRAPVHALLSGREGERDRRIVIDSAPRFGVVGETLEIDYRIVETGFGDAAGPVEVEIYADGELIATEQALPGEPRGFVADIPHGGRNILEFRAATDPQEISGVNNRAVVTVNGIRENLRVLLVSGEPHAGERTWRNLLKSDASVDLVHFTILRPPEKQDGTPINQLSLIAFPTRELFIEKIDEFDLIIFDRYSRGGEIRVLPDLYFQNIARYVEEGGALLIAAGPELGDPNDSIAEPLFQVMPAIPDGTRKELPFLPRVTDTGLKHPVTRALDGWNAEKPKWGRWFRSIGVSQTNGETVMSGEGDAPLLLLNRAGEGRVALFLTDHIWLWARGYEGGGPHVQLLRRTAHWLMKEPELDEERLTAEAEGRRLTIDRQTLGEDPGEAVITAPDGSQTSLPMREVSPGLWRAETQVADFGLYSAQNGDLRALVHAGPQNPREYAEIVSTAALIGPALEGARGSVRRAEAGDLPRVVPVRPGATASGQGWIGLENTQASVLKGVRRIPLFSGFLGLALLIFAFSAMWAREGR
jgi:hypothetical protein